ncbi:dihydromonapterin reductase [Paraglaciecola aquimarina]|uniref:Dihydromonapterin reductase n=1 Tax=Paraglaciecola aquimarina TaxID=1235557 RepID=A0ABU3SUX8_9ALTE|nr:dihydromonapterin reductase [Paraglaciecola aquimarina]MDU0353818.1 dihydromonapterin reductase [Paraglaciecola aquimarina]
MPTVVITGVGQRLGLCLAEYFLSKKYKVVGTYRTPRAAIDTLRLKGAELYQVNFYRQQQVQQFISSVTNNHNTIDCLIHNASDWHDDKGDLDFADYHAIFSNMMTIHAEVPYQLNLAFKQQLSAHLTDSVNKQQQQYSDIIHISDYVAFKGSKKHIAYAASKAALENLTLSFAQRYSPNIKVNSIAPALLAFNNDDDDNYKTKARNKSLLQTEGSFQEVLNTVEWLLASHYITGRTIHLDGGRHLK